MSPRPRAEVLGVRYSVEFDDARSEVNVWRELAWVGKWEWSFRGFGRRLQGKARLTTDAAYAIAGKVRDLEETILILCAGSPIGMTESELDAPLRAHKPASRASAISKLLGAGKLRQELAYFIVVEGSPAR